MSQAQQSDAKQTTTNEGVGESKVSETEKHADQRQETQENTDNGQFGSGKLDMTKQTAVGSDNQQTASAALSQQQQPQKSTSQSSQYMSYYNGVMPPFYQSFPYSNISNTQYKYYNPKATYNGSMANQFSQDNQPGFLPYQAPHHAQQPAQGASHNQLQPSAKQPQISAQQIQALQDHQHQQPQGQQIPLPQHASTHVHGVENIQISQYQPTSTFKVGRPKKTEDKITKSKFSSKFKSKDINDRPYACSFPGCDWAFARQSDLRRHSKSHAEPSYHCPYWRNDPTCHRNGGAFNRLDVLKRHLKLVHYVQDKHQIVANSKEDPGWCRACQRMFPNSKSFIDHCLECAQQLAPAEWKSNDSQKNAPTQANNVHNNQGMQIPQQYITNNKQGTADNHIYQISDMPKLNNQDSNILQSPPPNTASSGPQGNENANNQNENKDNESFFLEKISSNSSNQNYNVFNNTAHTNPGY